MENYKRVKLETSKRTEKFKKCVEEEKFLEELNNHLQIKERKEYADIPIQFPIIFTFGVPRTGTTILTQLLSHCLEVGFINNFSARFWLAPVHGIRLSRIIIGHDKGEFNSEFGRTKSLHDPHEFGYFWYYWLNMQEDDDFYKPGKNISSIDWNGLKKTLANIQTEFNKPMVMKNYFGVPYFEELNKLANVLWIYIERNDEDVVQSIYNARVKYYNNPNKWWSIKPPEYDKIKELPYQEQIPAQVYYLKKFYQKKVAENKNTLKVSYEELCASPMEVLDKVCKKIKELYGKSITIKDNVPSKFEKSTHKVRDELKRGIKKYF